MMLAPDKKIILRCFFDHKVIYLCAKFPLCQTPATDFLPINITSFANISLEYFFNKFSRVFHQSKLELSDQKLALYFYKFLKALIVWIAAQCSPVQFTNVINLFQSSQSYLSSHMSLMNFLQLSSTTLLKILSWKNCCDNQPYH